MVESYITTVVNNSDSDLELKRNNLPGRYIFDFYSEARSKYDSSLPLPKNGGMQILKLYPNSTYRQYWVGSDADGDEGEILITLDDCVKYEKITIQQRPVDGGQRTLHKVERSAAEIQRISVEATRAKRYDFETVIGQNGSGNDDEQPPVRAIEPARPAIERHGSDIEPCGLAIEALVSDIEPPPPTIEPPPPATWPLKQGYREYFIAFLEIIIIIVALAASLLVSASTTELLFNTSYTLEILRVCISFFKELMTNLIRIPTLLVLAEIWYFFYYMEERRITWKFHFWRYCAIVFGDHMSSRFADYVREMLQGLAPCNYFQGAVRPSEPRTMYVAKSLKGGQHLNPPTRSFSSPTQDRLTFTIGEGQVVVKKIDEEQILCKCIARGSTMEEFGALIDSRCIARVISILEYWESSPNVGVIENLIHRKEGVYCHCLNLEAIVEAVSTTIDCFSVFKLQEPQVFLVGTKEEGVPSDSQHIKFWLPLFFSLLWVVANYYQLVADYKSVAIKLTCLFVIGTILDIVRCSVNVLIVQKFCHDICRIFGVKGRLSLYRWMKKRDWCLAFSDDFIPVLRPRGDQGLILMKPSTYGHTEAIPRTYLNWERLNINRGIRPNYPGYITIDSDPGMGSDVIEYYMHSPAYQRDARTLVLEFPGGQRLHAVSLYLCPLQTRTLPDKLPSNLIDPGPELKTDIRFDDDECIEYMWSESNYHLFMYIMISWRKTTFGAVKHFKTPFFSRRFIEVRGVHELASLIQQRNITRFHELPGRFGKPNDMMA